MRQPVEADIPSRVEIPRDAEENRMYGGDGTPKTFSPEEVRQRLTALTSQNSEVSRSWVLAAKIWPDGLAVSQPKGRYIGQITIFAIDPDHRNARLRMGIYDRRFWSQGYGREAVRRILQHAFDDLHLHRMALRVAAYNLRAIRSYESCGFVVEGRERESLWMDEHWWDDVIMGVLDSEFQQNGPV
nr:GNAT family protein [Sulfobacillus harzensis]